MAAKENLRVLGFTLGAALFFATLLLGSFFIVIVLINTWEIPGDQALNFLMLGLIPPAVGTFLLFTKVLGRFM